MEFINLTFADMIKCCKDRSIVEYKNREIALSDGLYAGMRKEWFNGTNQVLIKQKDNDNHWSNSFAICCPKDTKSFEKLVEGEKLTIKGVLDFANDRYDSCGVFIRLINCHIDA